MRSLMIAAAAACAAAAAQKGLYGMGMDGENVRDLGARHRGRLLLTPLPLQYVLQSYTKEGVSKNIGQPIAGEIAAQELSSLDQENGIYVRRAQPCVA